MDLEDGICLAQQEMEQKDATKMRKVGASMRFSMVSELRSRGETLDACSEVKVRSSTSNLAGSDGSKDERQIFGIEG